MQGQAPVGPMQLQELIYSPNNLCIMRPLTGGAIRVTIDAPLLLLLI